MEIDGLFSLLELHQQVIVQEDGYWVKIDAWQVAPTNAVPHGIRYSLTLHNPAGTRILGYDNAHAFKPSSSFTGRKLPYDHKHHHSQDRGTRYVFKDAYQLLSDFFIDVDKALKADKEK
jgi:hypothetical protein